MTLSLPDLYYIKALDGYPYALEEVVENLNYALSYNPDHVAANCLMGQLYMEQLKDLQKAEQYIQQAIAADPEYTDAYIHYITIAFGMCDYAKAEKLINFIQKLKGVNKGQLAYQQGMLYEQRREYCKAMSYLNEALLETYTEDDRNLVKTAIERVQEKLDATNSITYEIK